MKGLSSQHARSARCKKVFFSVFNIANAALGAGILAFPYAFYLGGWGLGIILLLFSAISNAYSLTVILYCAREYETESFQGVVEKMFGKGARALLLIAILIYTYCVSVGYLIIISNNLSVFLSSFDSIPAIVYNKLLVPVAAWVITLPLTLIKSLDFLGPFSIVGVLAVVYVVAMLVAHAAIGPVAPVEDTKVFDLRLCALQGIPIAMFGMFCHLTAVPACAGLKEYWPSKRRKEEKGDEKTRFRTLVIVAIASIIICLLMYLPTGYVGYRIFGGVVQADVLGSFGLNVTSGKVMSTYVEGVDVKISRLCMALTTALGYPVQIFVGRLALWDIIGTSKYMSPRYILFTLLFSGVILGTSILMIKFNFDIAFVMSMTAATSGCTIQWLFPSLMLIKLGQKWKGYFGCLFAGLMCATSLAVTIINQICKLEFPADDPHPDQHSEFLVNMCNAMGLHVGSSSDNFPNSTEFELMF